MAGRKRQKVVVTGELAETLQQFYADPLGFVLFALPWGDPETILAHEDGPDIWQARVLKILGDNIAAGMSPSAAARSAIRIAVRSGHGIGKTALVAWIILWFMSTRIDPQIVVTANTKQQLDGKTWRELAKWHKLLINEDWFQWTATKFYNIEHPETWFASAVPWSKDRAEAFAGTHETNVLIIFDEASGIEDMIWDTAEGAMTTPGAIWLAFGNPTRNTGRFRECFRRFRKRWIGIKVDSRIAKKANKKQLEDWIEDYGEDSDFVRIRVKGEFPRVASTQFIGEDLVLAAAARVITDAEVAHAPNILSLDVARFGDDESVLGWRKGNKVKGKWTFPELDTYQLAYRVMEIADEIKPEAIFIEEVGVGVGVIDVMTNNGYVVRGVMPGRPAADPKLYANLRAQCWGYLRNWLKRGGNPAVEDKELDDRTKDDLTGIEYGYDNKGRIQMESKKDMKKRGLPSPDHADWLAISFAEPVQSAEEQMTAVERMQAKMLEQQDAGTTWMST